MATVYLHIGAPKTATSAMQGLLAGNQDLLRKQGVLYPQTMRTGDAHHLLVCDLIEKYQGKPMPDVWYGDYPRGTAWQALKDEIAAADSAIDSVILSSELFFGQVKNIHPALEEVAGHLSGHNVKVVAYLRRQDQLYSSFYNQDVKGVRQWRYSAYEFYETHQMLSHDYLELLSPWSDVFGKDNIILRPFEKEQWPDGDMVKEFSATLGGLEMLTRLPVENNEGLGPVQLYYKRALNRVGFDKAVNETVVAILKELAPDEPPAGNCQYVNRGLYKRFRKQWRAVNAKLSTRYLGGEPLFAHEIPHPRDIEPYTVDRYGLAMVLQNMVQLFERGKYPEYRDLFYRSAFLAMAEHNLWRAIDDDAKQTLLAGV